VEQAVLFLRRPASPDLLPEALCDSQGQVRLRPALSSRADTLPPGSLPQLLLQGGAGDSPYRYDLPITRSDQLIGVLKLEFPADAPPGPAEIRSLKSIPPVAALALEVWMLQMLAVEEAQASQSQRRQIAQNLHDTLAQNIGYLRLKLDQLTGENAIHEIGVVLQELEHMRATADEAYRQVRGTLEELDPLSVEDLPASLQRQAGLISQRAGFTLRLSQLGSPYPLPAGLRQQILYIAREALHNVEKHARATQALIQLTWLENELIVKICDDGAGFDPRSVTGEGHYGLWIMERRAQELGGMIKIQSARPGGTEVTLWAPRPDRVMQPRVEQA
jgi:signal transduction histidine kinase